MCRNDGSRSSALVGPVLLRLVVCAPDDVAGRAAAPAQGQNCRRSDNCYSGVVNMSRKNPENALDSCKNIRPPQAQQREKIEIRHFRVWDSGSRAPLPGRGAQTMTLQELLV
jgi:hypothetical protein